MQDIPKWPGDGKTEKARCVQQMAYTAMARLWQIREGPVMAVNSYLLPFVPFPKLTKTEKALFKHVYWD